MILPATSVDYHRSRLIAFKRSPLFDFCLITRHCASLAPRCDIGCIVCDTHDLRLSERGSFPALSRRHLRTGTATGSFSARGTGYGHFYREPAQKFGPSAIKRTIIGLTHNASVIGSEGVDWLIFQERICVDARAKRRYFYSA